MPNEFNARTPEELAEMANGLSRITQDQGLELSGDVGRPGLSAVIKNLNFVIDKNIARESPSQSGIWATLFGSDDVDPNEPAPIGAKDKLKGYIAAATSGVELAPEQVKSVEAAMASAGYDKTVLNGNLAEEKTDLADFAKQLESNISLSAIFTANADKATAEAAKLAADAAEAERKAAVEADAKLEQNDISGQVNAGLVMSGYLKAEDAADPQKSALAMGSFIVANTPSEEWRSKIKEIYPNSDKDDFAPTAAGVTLLKTKLKGHAPMGLKEDLEDGIEGEESERVKSAQYYLRLMGNDTVQANGLLDQPTMSAGVAALQAPMESITGKNSGDVYERAMHGELDFMASHLTEGERAAFGALKPASELKAGEFMCQEVFLANIAQEEPERYATILAEENDKRASTKLEGPDGIAPALPIIAIAPDATNAQEREIAKNPASIIVTEAPIVEAGLDEGAVAATSRQGLAVFENVDKGLTNIVAALKENSDWGDGAKDGKMTLQGAAGFLQYANTEMGDGKPFSTVEPAPDNIAAAAALVGRDQHDKFDVNNPADMKDMLTGLIAYRNTLADGQPFTQEALEERSPLADPKVAAAIDRASGMDGIREKLDTSPVAPEPAAPVEQKGWLSSLTTMFMNSAEAAEASTAKPANEPTAPQTRPEVQTWNAMGL